LVDYKLEKDCPLEKPFKEGKILEKMRKKIVFILPIIVVTFAIATTVAVIKLKQAKPPPFISPLPSSEKLTQPAEENHQTISYYITTSQEFLTKARELTEATAERQQTPEEKQKIIELVNKALDVINQGISIYPTDDRVFAQRANIYQALTPFLPEAGKFAIQDLREAIKLNNQNPLYHIRLANFYLNGGNFEEAALAFYNAYQFEPTNVQTLYSLADALEKSGQLTKAQIYFEKLLSLLPANDENQPVLQKRLAALKEAITKANLQYLTSPGELAPAAAAYPEIIGTQELPIEQAANTAKVIIASNQELPKIQSSVTVSVNAKSGEGTIPAGQAEVTIYNNNVAPDRQIVIVPMGETKNEVIFVTARKASSPECLSSPNKECGWFKVGIDIPSKIDIKFRWWIVK